MLDKYGYVVDGERFLTPAERRRNEAIAAEGEQQCGNGELTVTDLLREMDAQIIVQSQGHQWWIYVGGDGWKAVSAYPGARVGRFRADSLGGILAKMKEGEENE